jgi:23S rRNA pseudouridine1911/1915/1917 synthase
MGIREQRSTVSAAEAGGRVDRVVQRATGGARAAARGLVDHGCVTRNGAPVAAAGERVAAGDEVVVRWDPARGYPERPKKAAVGPGFRVVFEDAHLVVVDKAAWLLTVPTDEGDRGAPTLLDAVWGHLSRDRRRDQKPVVVQRLDRGTSGLLVLARTAPVAAALRAQLRAHKPLREYRALVAGHLAAERGTFDRALATSATLSRYGTAEPDEGEAAVTHFEVLARLADTTFVRVWLETGRRHQIRAHFAEAGHPVLGDRRYRAAQAAHPAWTARRLALHAAVLAFEHPVTGAALRFESPLPPELERFVRRGPGR